MALRSKSQVMRGFDRLEANQDAETGKVLANAAKSKEGAHKRRLLDETPDPTAVVTQSGAVKRNRQHAKAKDEHDTAQNAQAAQNSPAFIPNVVENSSGKYLGSNKYRDTGDNSSLLLLGGAAVAAYLFVQLKNSR